MVIELNDPQQNKKGAAGSFFLNIDTASENYSLALANFRADESG